MPREAPEGKTILVVDDEPEIVELLARALEPEGFRLLKAYDGDGALQAAISERPDLILLDWMLPGMSGLEVCRRLRAAADPQIRDVPVVLITARTTTQDMAEGFAAGATDYLTKPFTLAHVRFRTRSWLLRAEQSAP
ncbi:MAG: response regulator [Chloroflexi bacterium]|nr:response regulator [Chloroflexota bacterium]